eukprot:COSAG06_NODE_4707_length_4023_cov_5.646789_3_plen_50_part_01
MPPPAPPTQGPLVGAVVALGIGRGGFPDRPLPSPLPPPPPPRPTSLVRGI